MISSDVGGAGGDLCFAFKFLCLQQWTGVAFRALDAFGFGMFDGNFTVADGHAWFDIAVGCIDLFHEVAYILCFDGDVGFGEFAVFFVYVML